MDLQFHSDSVSVECSGEFIGINKILAAKKPSFGRSSSNRRNQVAVMFEIRRTNLKTTSLGKFTAWLRNMGRYARFQGDEDFVREAEGFDIDFSSYFNQQ